MAIQLFLAFDHLRKNQAQAELDLAHLSAVGPFGVKFNLDAMLGPGTILSELVRMLSRYKRPLFADLKMWNGSRTMESVVKTFVDLGVDFVNVYALADKQLEGAVKAAEGSKTAVLGLTVLSHYDDAYCQKWFRRTVREAVIDFSRFAVGAGCEGILLPGTMLDAVRDLDTIKIATGLRPVWYKDSRHEQEATPAEIAKGGAHFAVCGSPVLKQPTPEEKVAALQKIMAEMQEAVVA